MAVNRSILLHCSLPHLRAAGNAGPMFLCPLPWPGPHWVHPARPCTLPPTFLVTCLPSHLPALCLLLTPQVPSKQDSFSKMVATHAADVRGQGAWRKASTGREAHAVSPSPPSPALSPRTLAHKRSPGKALPSFSAPSLLPGHLAPPGLCVKSRSQPEPAGDLADGDSGSV